MNVYDFDDTIYNGESALDFFFFYLKKTPSLIKQLPRVLYVMLQYKRGKITVDDALRKYAPMVEDYMRSIPDFNADVKEFWDKHMKKIRPFYASLQQPDDIVVTASLESSMAEICRRLGISHCVGSRIDPETGRVERLCMRSHKVPAFQAAFPDAHIDNFYTDSLKNDAPLAALADHVFEVKGNKIRQVR